ncbi:MAG: TonB-dependent receptor domain-containing protein, partial [Pyrinomonadaceae bacterium]
CALALCASQAFAQSQSNAADLQGFVRDQQEAVVTNATVTATNKATGVSRTAQTNDEGFYQIVNLPPGEYEVTVEAANFSKASVPSITLQVGQRADLDVPLQTGQLTETITVSEATTNIVETSKTTVSNTIDERRIDNLPINERSATGFALTLSTVGRDNGRPIGPAPSSGLNIGGQRGRSTQVNVDGADFTDNSVNAARTTVSQEAVQEYQVATNSYAPEFGRATGGVVNVVTKGGTNDIRGNLFGFIRHKSIQARNAFAPLIDNDPDKKPPFTRAQYGATIGGPLKRDRTFFFFAFEQRRRQESGFFTTDVTQGLTSSVAIPIPGLGTQTFRNITAAQASYINGLLATGNAAAIGAAVQYAYLASSGGSTALNGTNPLISTGGAIPAGQPIGQRFLLTGTPVPVSPIAFRPLTQLQKLFPISDDTTFSSVRLDHQITNRNQLTMRFGYNPSDVTGIQVESQNQSLGQNDFSRTGIQTLKDTSFSTTLNSVLTDRIVNEARFSFGKRKATFRSQNGAAVSFNISDTAFIGRELFSPVVRTENRYQYTDNVNFALGNHNFKFGGDANFISIDATFELNFAGLFNFGEFTPTLLGAFPGAVPNFTPVQSYGLGLPSTYIQGFGNPASKLNNRPFALFAQDSWKVRPNLTVNYGVRYDYEQTQQTAPVGFRDPLSGINLSVADIQAAQDAIGVQQGFPRDKNNFAPRLGVAYDIGNDGRTVIRAAIGLFYDHPLLAAAFNSDIADAAQQQQLISIFNNPAPTTLLNAAQIFQGTVIPCSFAGARPGVNCTPGVAPTANYQFGRQRFDDQTFPGFGTILPFTLPIGADFEYASATQANLAVERQLTKDMSLSVGYIFVGSHHLPHPTDLNARRNDLIIENFRRFAGRAPTSTNEANFFSVPTTSSAAFTVVIPGLVAINNATGLRFVSVPAANFFRPSGPNYFLVQALTGGAVTPAAFNAAIAGTLRTPGLVAPFGGVNAQVSDGNSNYNALNAELRRRFSSNFQFLASYTWSHSIDDSSDLQTLLLPQDVRNFRAERSDSLFDQRHRFVFSGLLASPGSWTSSDSGLRRFLSNFTVAPILELSSGRPFNIITNSDTNNDESSQTDRPSVAADGTLVLPGAFQTGSLGRNRGITEGYVSLDLRLTRTIPIGERLRLDLIAEGFNLFNRFNQATASPFFQAVNATNRRDGAGRYYSRATAAFDPRQFQFGLKLNF